MRGSGMSRGVTWIEAFVSWESMQEVRDTLQCGEGRRSPITRDLTTSTGDPKMTAKNPAPSPVG